MFIVLKRTISFVFGASFFLFFFPFERKESETGKFLDNAGKTFFYSMKTQSDTFISNLLAQYPQYFASVLDAQGKSGIQIIYTRIEQEKKDKVKLTDHTFNLKGEEYFYPASTVKLPVAILTLQRLNELKIEGLDMYSTMITGENGYRQTAVNNDPTATDGRPTIAHYIKKLLLVSDNDAFNRLYEFLGQEYINNSLHKMGFKDVQIIHRLDISRTEEENRQTNPVNFYDKNGKLLYAKKAENSKLVYSERDTKMGNGYLKDGNLVNESFDFSKKNKLPLADLHMIIRSIIYPESVDDDKQFELKKEDYDFLRQYMSMLPGESTAPVYPEPGYWNNYVKFLFYGAEKGTVKPGLRIFNKIGDAYGFLIDGAFFADYENNVAFFLSAVIYCNSDGIFNDDKYDYEKTGFPFLKNLGNVIYELELKRGRKKPVDLADFKFNYGD
jgi:hypothetical protein